jgi:adhesin transport system outer membrane protein
MMTTANHRTSSRLRSRVFFLLGASLALLAGCSSVDQVLMPPFGRLPKPPDPSYVVLVPSPDGTVGKVTVQGKDGKEQVLDQARQAATTDGQAVKESVGDAKLERDFGGAMKARPQVPEHFVLYFSDQTTLTPESQAQIPRILEAAQGRPVPDVVVIGHTDTLGSPAYNEKLAMRRVNTVADALNQAGLKAHTLATESRGKRDLLVKTPDNTFEPRNRRVEVSVR